MAALVVFASGYRGLHMTFYGIERHVAPTAAATEMATHSHNPEHPHGPQAIGAIGASPRGEPDLEDVTANGGSPDAAANGDVRAVYGATRAKMHQPRKEGMAHPDSDVAFVLGMLPHHQGAVDMAEIQLRYGTDPANRELASGIIQH